MNRKETIYTYLLDQTEKVGVDAQSVSVILNISRANVSHELNNLCKEGKVYKSSGRPVLFFMEKNQNTTVKECKLDELVKNNISLKKAVEQVKAAILYPPKGMNCLILGDTGVGKSMFAFLMYEYAKEMKVKKEGSPFIAFNCADYSNNPQLLTSQLFGVKKGTYTGAEADKIGLIEKANGGILFLDEIHRLPPEGQESLFTFLDTGFFRRMGEYENKKSDVLIISATTENPNSALLKTFTRRIPMIITIPTLKDRTLEERFFIIKSFFRQESIRLNRDIHASLNTIRAFLSYDCPNNIGQLKNDIQLVCAKAYSEFLTNIKSDVRINSSSLPNYIKDGLYKEKEHRVIWNKLVSEDIEYFKFSSSVDFTSYDDNEEKNSIYEIIEQKLEELKSKGVSEINIENILEKDITKYFQKCINGVSDDINKKNLLNILGEDILNCVDKINYTICNELKTTLSDNIYTALALHIDTLIKRIGTNKAIVNPELNKLKLLYPVEFKVALKIKKIIEDFVHHEIPEDEAGYLTIFLVPEDQYHHKFLEKVKVIIIAHGESTATSMSAVANKLLGENYVIGINAPLEISPSKVLDALRKVVKEHFSSSGYLLLVDMGSLTTFGEIIEKELNVPVKVISLVSTLHVLEAARKALLGFSLDDIYKEVISVNSYRELNRNINEPANDKNKIIIVTACLTGEGGSVALKSFINNNFKFDKGIFEVIPLNCLDMKYFEQQLKKVQKEKEILFIVTSFPVDLDIKQYSMFDVISMKVAKELQEIIDTKTTLLKMRLILKENIDNLDGDVLYTDITQFFNNIAASLSISLTDENLIGFILHLAFTISRLKKGEPSIEYPCKEELINKHKEIYQVVKKQIVFLCNKYYIDTTDDEICYIIKILVGSELI
ncbi:sigma 54-interacting transcriptional regulator [Clostridium psychrophilum]|uniref:sigma 54-interacting transcriptional regulator n=1 Tax=Clostridium psychrophilum TaxID=132926 RepID=UPI001C0CB2C3|nr:sigma-54-dependent transcriptional regulator [Clostridium psychrophilum]MBU3182898.1 sigma 54-interacting transcriptional regulator [Clostridium psychrophilum]